MYIRVNRSVTYFLVWWFVFLFRNDIDNIRNTIIQCSDCIKERTFKINIINQNNEASSREKKNYPFIFTQYSYQKDTITNVNARIRIAVLILILNT